MGGAVYVTRAGLTAAHREPVPGDTETGKALACHGPGRRKVAAWAASSAGLATRQQPACLRKSCSCLCAVRQQQCNCEHLAVFCVLSTQAQHVHAGLYSASLADLLHIIRTQG